MGNLHASSKFMGRRPKNDKRDRFGAWVLYLRASKKLSQEEIVTIINRETQLNLSTGTLSYWERSGNLAGRKTIPALARALGVSVATLLRLEEECKDGVTH